ncbi:molybdopterin molybdotransferase MoeA [Pseudothermotoga thermarum]|uniref:Molybdopterin molybdenumtransferase n=1 Tax=Pseudothermotoga thermarum DSM 5069 TaxID=688269 RepID=F7YW45_9THEM|nr:gephyrin-like molybdotransferase Glp [Pseudothermotoga thermarum]AEH50534.1 molybdenum cofactor synthesis domain protein [Pseudothermotoga thermarum DSM 5069]
MRIEKLKFATVEEIYQNYLPLVKPITDTLEIFVEQSVNFVLAQDLISEEDLPGFKKSIVDGYAVNSHDTKGASMNNPALLEFAFEVKIGEEVVQKLKPAQAAWVPTGGMVPEGADAVVMVEHTQRFGNLVEIMKSVAPGENLLKANEDVKKGQVVLRKGTRIQPKYLNILYSLGIEKLLVYRKPKVAIVSTGDEIVEPFVKVKKVTQVRDSNSYALVCWLKNQFGFEAKRVAHVRDDEAELTKVLNQCLNEYDAVVISGGSSIGVRDITAKVIEKLGKPGVVYHGAMIQPGKPTIFGFVDEKPILGLPGNPVSFTVSAYVFLIPVLRKMEGEEEYLPKPCGKVKVKKNIPSVQGREQFIRVKLTFEEGELMAEPLFSESASITNLVQADGFVRIPRGVEGVYAGEYVEFYKL